jgi:alkanesulfonate monooxygenase SsuD/methylene tetrahydromethanopterin reductase-like flavin-dependent oxidoreductase (luciferase family)
MKYALYVPTIGEFADARLLGDIAADAEGAGWGGVFIWDLLLPGPNADMPVPTADAWTALTVMALRTQRIRFGAIVTPLARRRPANLASQAAEIDRLSKGRLIFAAGLGAPDTQFTALGEDGDLRVRAEKVDESLELLSRFWTGESVAFEGKHYHVDGARLLPRPNQSPRVPIWIGAYTHARAPLRRAARWDGFVPVSPEWPEAVISPDECRASLSYIQQHREGDDPFDVVFVTARESASSAADVEAYAEAGVTWWLEQAMTLDRVRDRIRRGPPPY